MNTGMGSPVQADQIVIPAHRDPDEYRTWLQDQERTATRSLAEIDTVDASGVRRSRRRLATFVAGLLLFVAVSFGAWFALTEPGDATSASPTGSPLRPPATVGLTPPTAGLGAPTSPIAERQRVHEVQAGETLLGIAEAYGTTVDALMDLNQLVDPDRLLAGTSLRVPQTNPTGER